MTRPSLSRRTIVRRTLPALAFAAATLALSAAQADNALTVHVGRNDYFELTGFAQYSGTLETGLAAKGVKVDFSAPAGSFAAIIPAFASGQYDIVLTTVSSIFGVLQKAPDFKIFATQRINTNDLHHVILVPKDSAIQKAADLQGHSIAVNKGGTGEYLLKLAVTKYNLDASKITAVYLPPAAAATAFTSGQVDAWATFSSFAGNAIGKSGARVIASGRDLGDEDDVILLVSNTFATSHPDVLRDIYDILHEESVADAANPQQTVELTGHHLRIDPTVADYLTKDLTGRPPLEPIDDAAVKRFEEVADVYRSLGVVQGPLDIKSYTIDVTKLAP
jgi:sulfonate transport system substrate-binding protein